ncbi:MAG: hypothetical protein R3264_21140, partial [Anaerolineae bacterium]|nr:hypothetical protein [Anaerolineae bacterium]
MASITTVRPGLRSATLYWLGFIFTGLALIQLGLVRQEFSPNLILPLLALMLCAGGVEFLFRRQG